MNITERVKDSSIMFVSINRGDVFLCEKYYYIKTDDWSCNAVCLNDGRTANFNDDDYVYRVDHELVIK